jgi:hypothetical protein
MRGHFRFNLQAQVFGQPREDALIKSALRTLLLLGACLLHTQEGLSAGTLPVVPRRCRPEGCP